MKSLKLYLLTIIGFCLINVSLSKDGKSSSTSIQYKNNFDGKKLLKIFSSTVLAVGTTIYFIKILSSKFSDEDLRKMEKFSNILVDWVGQAFNFYLISSDHKLKTTERNNVYYYGK